jgi:hypothetical protein
MSRKIVIFIFGLIISAPFMRVPTIYSSPVSQQQICPEIVQTAFETTNEVCNGTGRNEACYGHVMLNAQFHAGYEDVQFSQVGDQVAVESLQALRLSGLDEATGHWGVAMMKLQANLPDNSPAQNTTLLLFGDVEIKDSILDETPQTFTVMAAETITMMSAPSRNAAHLGNVQAWETLAADGRTEDGRWIRVQTAEGQGWVQARQISHTDDLNQLQVLGADGVQFKPMQAFYFQNGRTQDLCSEVPASGLMIQTPEGAGTVRLWVNEVKIELGSTAYIQSAPGQPMTIRMIEGHAHVTTEQGSSTAIAGTEITIPMNENNAPAGQPSLPQPYTEENVQDLPISNLERPITIAPPLDEATLSVLQERVLTTEVVCGDAPFPACPAVDLDGVIEAIDGLIITIDGEQYVLSGDDPLLTGLRLGDHIRIRGKYSPDGYVLAEQIAYFAPPANNHSNAAASVPAAPAAQPQFIEQQPVQFAPPNQEQPAEQWQSAPVMEQTPAVEQQPPAYQPPVDQPPADNGGDHDDDDGGDHDDDDGGGRGRDGEDERDDDD